MPARQKHIDEATEYDPADRIELSNTCSMNARNWHF